MPDVVKPLSYQATIDINNSLNLWKHLRTLAINIIVSRRLLHHTSSSKQIDNHNAYLGAHPGG